MATNLSRSVVLKTHGHLASHHALWFHPAVVSICLLASAAAPLLSLKISVPSARITQARRAIKESELAIALHHQGIVPQCKGIILQRSGIVLQYQGTAVQCKEIVLQRSGIVPQHQGMAVRPKGIVLQRLGVVLQRKYAHIHCRIHHRNAN